MAKSKRTAPRPARAARPVTTRRAAAPRPARAATFAGTIDTIPFPGHVIKVGDTDVAAIVAVQKRLRRLGCGNIDVDGIFGPQTAAAVQLFQARFPDADGQPLRVDGMVGALTWAALFGADSVPPVAPPDDRLLAATLTFAASQVGVMEKPPGSNRGPEVDAYLKSVGLNPAATSYPWCAAFVYFSFQSAAKQLRCANPVIRTAGVLEHWQLARASASIKTLTAAEAHMQENRVRPGHIFVIDTGGGHGHTGLIEDVVAGKLVTIEGNTNDGGSREGIGVFRRGSRTVRSINLGFIDYAVS